MTTIITELRKVILTCNCILCIYIHMYLKKAVCWTSAFQIVSTNSEIMELTPCLVVIAATVTLAQTSLVTSNFIHTYAHWSFKAPQKQQCKWFNSKLRLLIYSGQNAVWNCAQSFLWGTHNLPLHCFPHQNMLTFQWNTVSMVYLISRLQPATAELQGVGTFQPLSQRSK